MPGDGVWANQFHVAECTRCGQCAQSYTLAEAVAFALEHNPDLAVLRKQKGIAEAGVVIARTYPFNPSWSGRVMGANGPAAAGVTNPVFLEQSLQVDIEVRGQGRLRREAAMAALSRAEWEIAAQEVDLAIRVMRAFDTYLYRKAKLQTLDQDIVQQEKSVERVNLLTQQNKLRPADLLLAKADVMELRGQRGPSRAQLVAAWNDLRRLLAVDLPDGGVSLRIEGSLAHDVPRPTVADMRELALQTRPDLHALRMAVLEAEQRRQLEVANRYGNPTVGPALEYNETRATMIGLSFTVPLPAWNSHRGEILQRQAEKERAMMDQHRLEVQIGLDLQCAEARLAEAKKWVDVFEKDALPTLKNTVEAFDKLFAQGDPSVDVLRMIDAQRRLVRARDSNLDALWELHQGKADLAQALGNLSWIVNAGVPNAVEQGTVAAPVSLPLPENPRAMLLPPQAGQP